MRSVNSTTYVPTIGYWECSQCGHINVKKTYVKGEWYASAYSPYSTNKIIKDANAGSEAAAIANYYSLKINPLIDPDYYSEVEDIDSFICEKCQNKEIWTKKTKISVKFYWYSGIALLFLIFIAFYSEMPILEVFLIIGIIIWWGVDYFSKDSLKSKIKNLDNKNLLKFVSSEEELTKIGIQYDFSKRNINDRASGKKTKKNHQEKLQWAFDYFKQFDKNAYWKIYKSDIKEMEKAIIAVAYCLDFSLDYCSEQDYRAFASIYAELAGSNISCDMIPIIYEKYPNLIESESSVADLCMLLTMEDLDSLVDEYYSQQEDETEHAYENDIKSDDVECYCHKCGKPLKENAAFCCYCGAKIK